MKTNNAVPAFNQRRPLKPDPVIGVGLRHIHYQEALQESVDSLPVEFVEVHAENFFAKGGATTNLLAQVSEKYKVSLHGTSLGLGSQVALPEHVLGQFSDLVNSVDPFLVSEHLCFNRAFVNNTIVHSGDLLPIAYNQTSLTTIVAHIQRVQESINRPILIENLSAYLDPHSITKQLQQDEYSETEFLLEMCQRSGCGLLLDLNNLIINELNRNNGAPLDILQQKLLEIPPHLVGEIHLAGFTHQPHTDVIIDDHGNKVSSECWELYEFAMQHFNNPPTLVEWDTNLPSWQTLINEASTARAVATAHAEQN